MSDVKKEEYGNRSNKFSLDKVIKQFRSVHGDKYQYHLVDYQGNLVKVKIVCAPHGAFMQTPANHKNGNGCPECGKHSETRSTANKKRFLTTAAVIKQFEEAHGQRYDYSLVEYKANQQKVKIKCTDHGIFEQTPDHHKKGRGCPLCANIERSNTLLKKKVRPVYATVKEHLIATGQLTA